MALERRPKSLNGCNGRTDSFGAYSRKKVAHSRLPNGMEPDLLQNKGIIGWNSGQPGGVYVE
jgi:hypothetical protein